jgi:hypothetical protein
MALLTELDLSPPPKMRIRCRAHRLRKLGLDVKQQYPLKVYDEDGTLMQASVITIYTLLDGGSLHTNGHEMNLRANLAQKRSVLNATPANEIGMAGELRIGDRCRRELPLKARRRCSPRSPGKAPASPVGRGSRSLFLSRKLAENLAWRSNGRD